MNRLFVSIIGNRNSGKSSTWNTLFGKRVHTGKNARRLILYGGECVDVFVISGSFEERGEYAEDVLADQRCRIILCSTQYRDPEKTSLEYAARKGFQIYAHWLNPGWSDPSVAAFDQHGMMPWLLARDATVAIRDGHVTPPTKRVEEIRQFVFGWAKARGLTYPC